MIVETEGVVLHAMKYGDTSKIVALYTKKFGKIKVIAKGVRSQKNKLGSSLEPMTISSFVLYKKEHKDLHFLSKSEIAIVLNNMQNTAERMYAGLALIELVDMVMHDEEENDAVYSMLVASLTSLDSAERNHVNILLSFMLHLFVQFGFGISIRTCSVCGTTVDELQVPYALLRLSDGKFVCSNCAQAQNSSGVKIDGGMLKSLYYLQENDIHKASALTLSPSMKNDITATLESFLRFHIENARTLRSLSLLQTTGT